MIRAGSPGQGFSQKDAEAWCAGMQNEDGTTGAHWSLEEIKAVLERHGLSLELFPFWAAMNATYSDLCAFFKKYNIDTMDAYYDYTMAFWFGDKDAAEDKLGAYYAAVVG